MFLVVTVPWSAEQRDFVVVTFFKNAGCVTATQGAFHTRFGLNQIGRAPDQKNILNRVQNLRAIRSV